MGDPAGIGPDILLAAWVRRASRPALVAIADPDLLAERARMLDLDLSLRAIGRVDEVASVPDGTLPVLPVALSVPSLPGKPD